MTAICDRDVGCGYMATKVKLQELDLAGRFFLRLQWRALRKPPACPRAQEQALVGGEALASGSWCSVKSMPATKEPALLEH